MRPGGSGFPARTKERNHLEHGGQRPGGPERDDALNELLTFRASVARMEAAGETLLAAVEKAQTERREDDMPHPELRSVTLQSLGGGALGELFEHELARVLLNVEDENTDAITPRTITIKVTLIPSPSRDAAMCRMEVNSKLAGIVPASTVLYLSREEKNGPLMALTSDNRQLDIPFAGEKKERTFDVE